VTTESITQLACRVIMTNADLVALIQKLVFLIEVNRSGLILQKGSTATLINKLSLT
jgi:hypothetical protein